MDKPIYDNEVAVVKKYGFKYKLTVHRTLRRKGIECESDKNRPKKGTVNEVKLLNNIARARARVYELAMCNPWDYFCTFTLDKSKYNRYDIKKYIKDLGYWIGNYNKKYDTKLKYIIIPEKHTNGAWHLHALFTGIEWDSLTKYTYKSFPSGKIPTYIRTKIENNEEIYYMKDYSDKFGYCLIEAIKDKNKISSYVLKYFSKDMSRTVTELNSRLFYSSQKLNTAQEIVRGHITAYDYDPQFENEYVSISWIEKNQIDELITKVDYNRPYKINQDICNIARKKIKQGLIIKI